MTNIYTRFDRATSDITAIALLRNGKPVGRIVIKYGAAATAYVQIWGAPMATARATGGGYDKATAAVMSAVERMTDRPNKRDTVATAAFDAIRAVASEWDGGTRYTSALVAAGFMLALVV